MNMMPNTAVSRPQPLSELAEALSLQVAQCLSGIHQLSQDSTVGWLHARGVEIGGEGLAVEVGTWVGGKAIALALGGPRVIAVDTFQASDGQTGSPALERLQRFLQRTDVLTETLQEFCRNVARAGVGDRVVGLVGSSPQVAEFFPPLSCDLVFLDGDHSREAVHADLDAWGPRVKRGGILCGHDREQGTVREPVTTWVATHQPAWGPLENGPDQIWWVRRLHGE